MKVRTDRIESIWYDDSWGIPGTCLLRIKTFSGGCCVRAYDSEAKRDKAARMITSFKVFWLKVDD